MLNQEVRVAVAKLNAAVAALEEPGEDVDGTMVEAADLAYSRLLTVPAQTLSEVSDKLEAIARYHAGGEVPTGDLAVVIGELRALVRDGVG